MVLPLMKVKQVLQENSIAWMEQPAVRKNRWTRKNRSSAFLACAWVDNQNQRHGTGAFVVVRPAVSVDFSPRFRVTKDRGFGFGGAASAPGISIPEIKSPVSLRKLRASPGDPAAKEPARSTRGSQINGQRGARARGGARRTSTDTLPSRNNHISHSRVLKEATFK